MSGVLPCLAPIAVQEKTNCSQLIPPVCKLPNETLSSTDQVTIMERKVLMASFS